MPPRRTYNERRARVHLTKKRAHVHARACNVHVVPTNVLRIFSYPKFCCLIFFYDKNWGSYVFLLFWAHAFKKRHVHVPTCTWRTWHVVTHVEETHTESHKKIWADSVNGSHRNSTLKLFLSCSWRSVTLLGTCLHKTARAHAHVHVAHVGHKIRVAPKTHMVPQKKMPPRRTYNERRARVHLTKKMCTRACTCM